MMGTKLLCSVLLTTSLLVTSRANASELEQQLQNEVLRWATTIGEDVRHCRESTAKIVSTLAQWKVSPCELSSELGARQPQSTTKLRHVLNDLLERQQREYTESLKILEDKLDRQGKISEQNKQELSKVAFELAMQSASLSEIKDELIPNLFAELSEKLDRVEDFDIKITLLLGQLARLDSLCERMAATENKVREHSGRIARLEDRRYEMSRPVINYGASVLESGGKHSGIEGLLQSDIRNGIGFERKSEPRSVNGTNWEPQIYSDSMKYCANPTEGPTNVFFDVKILLNGRWVAARHYGDMWRNCSGQNVMIREKTVIME